MSKMNCLRIVNLNYNNNAMKMEDEIFELDGESTLLSLQNGGGKSVLVQMVTAPFVRKRYRDTKDRPFASYFTTNRPTHILVEWVLDSGAGYVLTGLMVRKKQDFSEEDEKEELEITSIIYEYKESNAYDIRHIPIVEQDGKKKKLLGYQAVLKLYEQMKQEKSITFQKYDMNQSAQQRQYFTRLKQYQINHGEWESIIKKVNLKESGLSELFKDAKDESGLIDKWFLSAVESKLNKEENRMKQFSSILYKYFTQYKQNEAKMERKDTILTFCQDAKEVQDRTDAYEEAAEKQTDYEKKIGSLSVQLKKILEKVQRQAAESEERILNLENSIHTIQYEELSYQGYQMLEDKGKLLKQEQEFRETIRQMEEETAEMIKRRNILECARLLEEYKESSREVQNLENRLELLKQDEQNNLPERNNLGYNLRVYYEKEREQKAEELETANIRKQEREVFQIQKEAQRKHNEERQQEYSKRLGSVQEKLKQYDVEEEHFCRQYQAELRRNILGTYEEGTIYVLQRTYEKEQETLLRELSSRKQEKMELETTFNTMGREIEEKQKEQSRQNLMLEKEAETLSFYEEERKMRREALRYIGFSEEREFEDEEIQKAFYFKIESLKEGELKTRRNLENLKIQYQNMESGKILKLPEELARLLGALDIHFIYGMEYLKKNGCSKEENEQLVSSYPLLPYSILMSRKEVEKLEKSKFDFYMSFPVPVTVRENLSNPANEGSANVVKADTMYFLTSFNQGLLDEEALKRLLVQKKKEIGSEQEKLERKQEEICVYEDKRDLIKHQKVTREAYQSCEKRIVEAKQHLKLLDEEISRLRQKKESSWISMKQLDGKIEVAGKKEIWYENRKQDFEALAVRYEVYLDARREHELILKKIEEGKESLKKIGQEQKQAQVEISQLLDIISQQKQQHAYFCKKASDYKSYQSGEKIQKDIEDIEARYEAITTQVSSDLKELERSLKRERDNFRKRQDALLKKQDSSHLEEPEFRDVIPDEFRESELEREEKSAQIELKSQEDKLQQVLRKLAVCESEIKNVYKQVKSNFDEDELIPKAQITNIEFKKRIRLARAEVADEKRRTREISKKIQLYQTNVSTLAEYENLETEEACDFSKELESYEVSEVAQLPEKHLDTFRGELIRDYRMSQKNVGKSRNVLDKKLEDMQYNKIYEDEFFQKPIESLRHLIESPSAVKEQLDVVLGSYQALLKQLEIDLSMVAKEKEKILEMLFDYVRDVHKHLGKIDRNSTITIQGRSLKMLRLNLLNWEEEENTFFVRLKNFIEGLTNRAMERLAQNENMEEVIGAALTTRNLYDSVVGISTIGIKLYKIEADREYPITWKEVAKNSGGEGFLSAFVVLSSLLSYMRRDDTDLFVEREEGKVLIMDNPFAQTNASHLLKPLMDIAKKSNTQLICLSGLGGESIYNRFDNIYVLNLMKSGLTKDLSYVKAEHVKGSEKEAMKTVKAARIEVEDGEQMELVF